ncbi:MAG: trehalose/maltose transport system permease protein [Nocardioidaceae bacterium]|jgi:multiple sugar transport system permease protein|nr:trehalose/maltose transport system permease protein [Nocardioidaceae bacterium]
MSSATQTVAEAPRPTSPNKRRRKLFNFSEGGGAPFLVAPTLIVLAVVIGYPVVKAVFMSFQKDPGLDKATGLFVSGGFAGFSNYTHWILQQCNVAGGGTESCPAGSLGAEFWTAMGNTVLFTVISVAIEVVLGMWFAMIMHRKIRGRGLVRAAILIPWAIPTAVTAKLFFFIFAFSGVANKLLHAQILWTGDAWPARFAVIAADVWKTTPFMALLILAGLQVIPEEVYEAAKVDGASTLQRFMQITLPLVKPALMVAILFRTLDVLRIFDLPYILTGGGGGKGDATTTLSILVISQIRQGFNSAAALSTITFIFIFAVAFFFVKFLGANVVETQDQQRKAAR